MQLNVIKVVNNVSVNVINVVNNVNVIKKFFEANPKGKEEDDFGDEAPFLKTKWKAHELSRNNVSRAVWTILVLKEQKDKAIQKVFKGNLEASFIAFMEEVDE